jgi:hypothetical protein
VINETGRATTFDAEGLAEAAADRTSKGVQLKFIFVKGTMRIGERL